MKRRYGTYNETTQRSVILSGKKCHLSWIFPHSHQFLSIAKYLLGMVLSFLSHHRSFVITYLAKWLWNTKKKRCQHTNANELICLIILYLQPFNEKIEQKAVKLKGMMMVVFVCVCALAKIGKCFKILAYTINAQVQCIQIIMKRKRKERRVNSTIQSNTDTATYLKVG